MGAGVARALASRGAAVAVNDLVAARADEVAGAIERGGGRARPVAFDVTDADAVARGVAEVARDLGAVDVLVNNAGVPAGMGMQKFRETSRASWAPYVDLNLYGVLHCTHAVLDGMCERGFGRIVTISSGAGQVGLGIGVALYGAGKAGALGFMRHLAIEVARTGVTANSLALGMMDNVGDADAVAALSAGIPTGRLGTPEDVGASVVFLASDEAAWITGQTIGVNGGLGDQLMAAATPLPDSPAPQGPLSRSVLLTYAAPSVGMHFTFMLWGSTSSSSPPTCCSWRPACSAWCWGSRACGMPCPTRWPATCPIARAPASVGAGRGWPWRRFPSASRWSCSGVRRSRSPGAG